MTQTELDDGQLLRQSADDGSHEAFARLVRRHAGIVYAAAVRQLPRLDPKSGEGHIIVNAVGGEVKLPGTVQFTPTGDWQVTVQGTVDAGEILMITGRDVMGVRFSRPAAPPQQDLPTEGLIRFDLRVAPLDRTAWEEITAEQAVGWSQWMDNVSDRADKPGMLQVTERQADAVPARVRIRFRLVTTAQ